MKAHVVATVLLAAILGACGGREEPPAPVPPVKPAPPPSTGTFADDLTFLQDYTKVIVLSSADGRAQIAVAPGFQGRVMTSTADGPGGASFGYIHRPVIAERSRQPHMTVLGGEDRFWLGPEGGQYALYFRPGTTFETANWQVPLPIDWGEWPVVAQTSREVSLAQPIALTNYAGTQFELRVDRTIRLLDPHAVVAELGVTPDPAVRVVAYESDNRITNTGAEPWRRETGLVSIWILGMYPPARRTTVVIPFQKGSETERGPVVNDAYFGAQPPDRLKVGEQAIFFRGDGRHRGKIGVSKARTRDVAASYDPENRVLTIVRFTVPAGPQPYVNSMWAVQKDPYAGDVINSYNDGPLGPGQPPLGPFYEIESSSPGAALAPDATMRHVHRTLHLQGTEVQLDPIARSVLGVSLADVVASLP
jgi:Family of unknown function (DUF6786)